MHFSWAVAAAMALSAAVASLGPILLGVAIARKTGALARWWLFGALTFFVFQCVLRLPWQIALGLWIGKRFAHNTTIQYGWLMVSALTAALFEEVGRWLTIRTLMKKERSFRAGLMLGAGHGGFESMLLVGLGLGVAVVLYVALGLGVDLGLPSDKREVVEKTFAAMTTTGSLAGGLERVLAITFHLGCSALVMEGFIRSERKWLFFAILLHFATDSIAVAAALWIKKTTHMPLLAELPLVPFSLVALLILLRLSRATRPSPSSPSSSADPRPSP